MISHFRYFLVVGGLFANAILDRFAGNIRIAVCSIDGMKYLTNVDALAADFRWERSTMTTEMIVWIVVLFILFGGTGFYYLRNR
jgi:hypothetical protein